MVLVLFLVLFLCVFGYDFGIGLGCGVDPGVVLGVVLVWSFNLSYLLLIGIGVGVGLDVDVTMFSMVALFSVWFVCVVLFVLVLFDRMLNAVFAIARVVSC